LELLLDGGFQPLCNRFVTNPNVEEYRHPLRLGQCRACGLIQITQPVPDKEIEPRFEWLSYNEPESHLDHLADIIGSLPGISDNAIACGISYKDEPLLRRLKDKKIISRIWRIDPREDLGIILPGAGVETVQARLTAESAVRLGKQYGQANVVIARHIYEHASDTHRLLDALKRLVAPGGYIVFEVPDCTQILDVKDYSMLWEEHSLYFTPDTFRNSFNYTDFSLVRCECYPYPVENALVGITQQIKRNKYISFSRDICERELRRGRSYGESFKQHAERLQQYLKKYQEKKGKVVIFGAGHLSCMYINLMGIKDYIEFIIDDNPNKKGLYMPGSHLPIRSSDSLAEERSSLCLLSVRSESETKVSRNNTAFIKQGGVFASIFPTSKICLDLGNYEEVIK
jgi:hypothetical protein